MMNKWCYPFISHIQKKKIPLYSLNFGTIILLQKI
jgi:hypothetical protein